MPPEISSAVEFLKRQGRLLVVSHEKPDGDALGSLSGLLGLLRDNGIEAEAALLDTPPDSYAPFLQDSLLKSLEPSKLNDFSAIVSLDVSTKARLATGGVAFESISIPILNIDHHPDNELFGSANWVDSSASSTAEMVFRIAKGMSWRISPENATRLLLGIITDTGCLRFDNSSPDALRSAAELMELGADRHAIVERAYLSKPIGLAMLEADLLSNSLGSACGGRLVWFSIMPETLKKYSVEMRNTENLIETLRAIEGVDFAALLRPAEGGFKLSLRSKRPPLSAGRIARRLGGGGHEMAAGGFIPASSVSDAEKTLIENVEIEFNEAQARQA